MTADSFKKYMMNMQDKIIKKNQCVSQGLNRAFVAVTAVLLVAIGAISFSLLALYSANEYSDLVFKRALRIQNKLNKESCMEISELMPEKGYSIHVVSSSTMLTKFCRRLGL